MIWRIVALYATMLLVIVDLFLVFVFMLLFFFFVLFCYYSYVLLQVCLESVGDLRCEGKL